MTTFNIDGPIQQIITEAKYDIVSLTGGTNASPTPINPGSGAVIIALLSESGIPGSYETTFQLSSTFNVGDVVELYNDSPTRNAMDVLDENGNQIVSSGLSTPGAPNMLNGAIVRKVRTGGSGRNWGFTD